MLSFSPIQTAVEDKRTGFCRGVLQEKEATGEVKQRRLVSALEAVSGQKPMATTAAASRCSSAWSKAAAGPQRGQGVKCVGVILQWGSLEKDAERKQDNQVKHRVALKTKVQGFRKTGAFRGHPCVFKPPSFALEASTVSKCLSHRYFSSDPVNCRSHRKSLRNLPFTFRKHPNRKPVLAAQRPHQS